MSFTKIKNLYIAVNHVVAELGKDGEIQRRSEFVEDLLTALHDIDHGEFKPDLFDRAQTKLKANADRITELEAQVTDLELKLLTERGAKAWKDVSDTTAFVEELRGNKEFT